MTYFLPYSRDDPKVEVLSNEDYGSDSEDVHFHLLCRNHYLRHKAFKALAEPEHPGKPRLVLGLGRDRKYNYDSSKEIFC